MNKPEFPVKQVPDIQKIYKWLDQYLKEWKAYPQKAKDNDINERYDLFMDIISEFYKGTYNYISYYENQCE